MYIHKIFWFRSWVPTWAKEKKKMEIDYQNLKYSVFTGLQTSAEAPSEITLLLKKLKKNCFDKFTLRQIFLQYDFLKD